MKQSEGALSLGPDGYSRFFVIINTLEQLYKGSKKTIRVLDIGGCSPYLNELLVRSDIDFDLTILDILPKPVNIKTDYIQADATKNDMKDGSFDVVVSTDTLEHIPEAVKDDFVRACVRLGKDVCIIAAPFDTEGVDQAEKLVNDFNKRLFTVGQDWLEEHFSFGKPRLKQVAQVLDKLQVRYEHFGTNNLFSWVFSTHMNLIEAKVGIDTAKSIAARRRYNQALAQSHEFNEPTYRHFFVIYKNKNLAGTKPLAAITETQDPVVFISYLHDMLTLAADRMVALHYEAEQLAEANVRLEQHLQNEKIHSHKLNQELIARNAELQQLAPLRRLARLRHPKHVVKVIKRRITGK